MQVIAVSSSGITLTHLCDMAVLKALFKSMEIVASEKRRAKRTPTFSSFIALSTVVYTNREIDSRSTDAQCLFTKNMI